MWHLPSLLTSGLLGGRSRRYLRGDCARLDWNASSSVYDMSAIGPASSVTGRHRSLHRHTHTLHSQTIYIIHTHIHTCAVDGQASLPTSLFELSTTVKRGAHTPPCSNLQLPAVTCSSVGLILDRAGSWPWLWVASHYSHIRMMITTCERTRKRPRLPACIPEVWWWEQGSTLYTQYPESNMELISDQDCWKQGHSQPHVCNRSNM